MADTDRAIFTQGQAKSFLGELKNTARIGDTIGTPGDVSYISTSMLQDGAVTAAKLDTAAVTENKIANGAVTSDKIDWATMANFYTDSASNIPVASSNTFTTAMTWMNDLGYDVYVTGTYYTSFEANTTGVRRIYAYTIDGGGTSLDPLTGQVAPANLSVNTSAQRTSVSTPFTTPVPSGQGIRFFASQTSGATLSLNAHYFLIAIRAS